ncbi:MULTISPECIES: hypothetical protein [unclassified Streptomyces]|uniref:hypothetical protein n=1 Tax=unclassified Streptomyces TaxID=2593676 RepID=UPI001F48CB0A|nr:MULTISPECIES: hypothetical protein [unclassified Streptomyces]MCF0087181.1 hypothetical protein [Streptomyces sp. MH192]MCF0098981.1 hypothetical protein [Streptomyces sp. MH191]
MKGQRQADELAALEAGRAAGYCWDERPGGGGSCTRPPLHKGPHVDYYNGRRKPTDMVGYTWPQKTPVTGETAIRR